MKKLLSLIFVFLLAFTGMALPVSAEGCVHEAVYCFVCGTGTGELPEGCSWDGSTLMMRDMYLYIDETSNRGFVLPDGAVLQLEGENIIEGIDVSTAVLGVGRLFLTGSGSLEGKEIDKNGWEEMFPIYYYGDLVLKDCTLMDGSRITRYFLADSGGVITRKVVLGSSLDHGMGAHGDWTPLPVDGYTVTGSHSYYLAGDTVLPKTLVISNAADDGSIQNTVVNLCLNGHSLSLPEGLKGGIILVRDYAVLRICDCSGGRGKVTGGSGTEKIGGGITADKSTVELYSGQITGNKTGVVLGSGAFRMYGGSISGNEGSGLQASGSAVVQLSGEPVIDGNAGSNLFIGSGAKIRIDGLTGGKIGLTAGVRPTAANPTEVSDNLGADYTKYFYSDDPDFVLQTGDRFRLQLAMTPSSAAREPVSANANHPDWLPFPRGTARINESCRFYLTEDVFLEDTLVITGGETTVDICLNGYDISMEENARGDVIKTRSGVQLNIHDCTGTGCITGGNLFEGTYSYDSSHHATGVFGGGIRADGELVTLSDVTISGNDDDGIAGTGKVILTDCTITGNGGDGVRILNEVTLNGRMTIAENGRNLVMVGNPLHHNKTMLQIGPEGLTDSEIGVSADNSYSTAQLITLTVENHGDFSGCFFSDDPLYTVRTGEKNELTLLHQHDFGPGLKFNERIHWYICAECGSGGHQDAHQFDRGSCTVCGYESPVSGVSEPSPEPMSEPSHGQEEHPPERSASLPVPVILVSAVAVILYLLRKKR
ncbi:MAG: right-handed parallel beta-helix repeat-containing protein [Oscillospiraceae bacterium]|nr:right-handed parallel beta-helix repeat-containing protein [Oscillospiraceae bacterium]